MLSFFCIAPRTMLTLNNNSNDVYGSLLNSNGTGPVTVIRMGYYAVYKVSTVIPPLRKILKAFFPPLPIGCSKIVTEVQISISSNSQESSKLSSNIYFIQPAEFIGISAYAQFIQTYCSDTYNVFCNEAELQFS